MNRTPAESKAKTLICRKFGLAANGCQPTDGEVVVFIMRPSEAEVLPKFAAEHLRSIQ